MKIRIHEHTTYNYCEDCGLESSLIYSVSGDGISFKQGDHAYCYGTESGDIENVLKELFLRLQSKGIDARLPEMIDDDIDSVLNYESFIHSGYVHYLNTLGVNVKLTYSTEDYPDMDGGDYIDIEDDYES